jgi:hypothetical protein
METPAMKNSSDASGIYRDSAGAPNFSDLSTGAAPISMTGAAGPTIELRHATSDASDRVQTGFVPVRAASNNK